MSRSLGPKQLGVLSAALRHVRDAEHLLAVADPDRSPAQAWYLAGYGPECVRKAGLDDDWLNKTIGHGVVGASETVVAFALAHDPRPRRYGLDRLPAPHSVLDGWKVEDRYDASEVGDARDARGEIRKAVEEARRIVDNVLFALWVDGRVPETFRW